jgi:hypothetical protein
MAMLTSNQDLQKEITALEEQMEGLNPGSPQYIYDQLHLELEKEEQKIRDENPNLNPLNLADSKKLDELLSQDPIAQGINQQLKEISEAFSSEVSKWGIPWYFTGAVPV